MTEHLASRDILSTERIKEIISYGTLHQYLSKEHSLALLTSHIALAERLAEAWKTVEEMAVLRKKDSDRNADLRAQVAAAQAMTGGKEQLIKEACDLIITVQVDPKANIPAWFRLRLSDFLVKAAAHV